MLCFPDLFLPNERLKDLVESFMITAQNYKTTLKKDKYFDLPSSYWITLVLYTSCFAVASACVALSIKPWSQCTLLRNTDIEVQSFNLWTLNVQKHSNQLVHRVLVMPAKTIFS
ncbi:hypothetical protein GJ496_004313 [Pomphorhynchus laevis]|nr:hypothetical protein GJ496_004313 [Pomphorhynchus laevis]